MLPEFADKETTKGIGKAIRQSSELLFLISIKLLVSELITLSVLGVMVLKATAAGLA